MIVKELRASNFRLLEESFFEFRSGLNVIEGPNATGKTTILEAIGYCLRGKSMLGSQDVDAVSFGKDSFYLRTDFDQTTKSRVEVSFNGRKSVLLDGKPVRTSRALLEAFKVVTITPNSSLVAVGPPSHRRELLDDTASQINPSWAAVVSDFRVALSERNLALKNDRPQKLVDVMTLDFIALSRKLREARLEVVKMMNGFMEKANTKMDFGLLHPIEVDDFARLLPAEKARGMTLIGPHRDDCFFVLDGKRVDKFASTGEARSVMLTVKIAQADLISKATGIEPLVLADDLLAELDRERQEAALGVLSRYCQSFLTCACKAPEGNYNLVRTSQ
ncbi:MAG: DNA replication/repair protein RecF [Caldisericales bacterium]|nr:DNA replication/repair protein RecF [Caldisericales bacterium]